MNPLMPIKYSPKQRKKLRAFERKVLDKAKEIVNTKKMERVELWLKQPRLTSK